MSVKLAGDKLDGGTIQPLGFPDLSTYTEFNLGEEKTLISDGWLYATISTNSWSGGFEFYGKVDGVRIFQWVATGALWNPSMCFWFPVRKGQKVSVIGDSRFVSKPRIYPMLGIGT